MVTYYHKNMRMESVIICQILLISQLGLPTQLFNPKIFVDDGTIRII